jgi:DNA-directed DNA polymerase III PolC
MNQGHPLYLHTHSYYSFLESFLSPSELADLAAQHGLSALSLIDHQHLTGSLEFFEACTDMGIKPLLGLDIDLVLESGFQGQLGLLARDRQGWANLCRLSTLMLDGESFITLDLLAGHAAGLIALTGGFRDPFHDLWRSQSGDSSGPIHYLKSLKSIFGQDLFAEIQRYINGPLPAEADLIRMAKSLAIPLAASQEIFYDLPSKERAYRTLTAIRHNTAIHGLSQSLLPPGSAHFPTPQDFTYRFRDLPEAVENLKIILNRCELSLPIGEMHFPSFPTPDGISQDAFLREKAYQGAKKHYQSITSEIVDRLEHELTIIADMGYEPIFLIVQDVLQQARKLGIPTSSRGSAASSLVAHCLDITSPDPLALNLYFERFLNPARKKPPDIDTDIASHRRDEVIQYVFDRYGENHVAMVGTINCYRPKSALGDVAKAYGLNPETIRQLSKKCPSSFRFQRGDSENDPFGPLLRERTIPIITDIVRDARQLLDIPRHLSVHPGGIIIAPFPITDLVPLVRSESLGIHHAQFDLDGIEKLGLVKIDLLGIRGLTVLGEVANRIRSWRISEFADGLEVLEKIPEDDSAAASIVTEARTIGCFQIESPGMRATLKEIHARTVSDIMAALALYRPGPLKGGLRDAFVRRFRNEEEVSHIHPSLRDLLSETLGVILYQEQVLRIAHELGGLTLAQADILRRAMSHFDPGGVMDTLKKNFIAGAEQRRQVPPEIAERIWEMMAAFAGYGFPKAHAASYAQLAWNSAWCKAHFPAEFMAAVLGYGGGYYSQRVYLMEARRLGLTVNPPHINHANQRFRVTYPKGVPQLYMGLGQVRDLTHRTIERIIENRPFASLEDFIIRVDPQKKEAQHLAMCGALEGLTSIPQALERLEFQRPPGQLNLFTQPEKQKDWNLEQKLEAQQAVLGVNLTLSPLEQYADQIAESGALSTLEALSMIGEKIVLAGMRQTWRRFRSQNGGTMCFLNLEDMEGTIQVRVPPHLYRRYHHILQDPGPFLIEGQVMEHSERDQQWVQAETIRLLK